MHESAAAPPTPGDDENRPVAGVGRRSSVALRLLIGAQLRRLREGKGITREAAAYVIRGSESKISRMELGRVGFKYRDLDDLLALYGMTDGPARAALLDMVRRSNQPAWWYLYHDVAPFWFRQYLGLEDVAELIRTYESQFVPGLLQTEDYARAVMRLGRRDQTEDEIGRRVRLRLRRQQEVLHRPDPPTLWAVVEEAALRRPVGGTKVLRDQIEALDGMLAKLPHIRLQIVPTAVGGHAAAGGSFAILRLPGADLNVVYAEQLDSALYLEETGDVEIYTDVMDRLSVEAEPSHRTRELLNRIVQELEFP